MYFSSLTLTMSFQLSLESQMSITGVHLHPSHLLEIGVDTLPLLCLFTNSKKAHSSIEL